MCESEVALRRISANACLSPVYAAKRKEMPIARSSRGFSSQQRLLTAPQAGWMLSMVQRSDFAGAGSRQFRDWRNVGAVTTGSRGA